MTPRRRWGGRFCLVAHLVGLALAPVAVRAEEEPGGATPAEEAAPDSAGSATWSSKRNGSATLGVIGSAAGILAGAGLSMWLKSEADEQYDLYLDTADPDAAAEYLDSAERYDRTALVGFAIAQVSFVALIYFLSRSDDRELVPIRGEPVVRFREGGTEVGVRFRP